MITAAEELHPPNDSTTKGINSMWAVIKMCAILSFFRYSKYVTLHNSSVFNGNLLDGGYNSNVQCCWASPLPSSNMEYIYISAGQLLELAIRDGLSFLGPRAADCASEKRTSLKQLWRRIRSTYPRHVTRWSPIRSEVAGA